MCAQRLQMSACLPMRRWPCAVNNLASIGGTAPIVNARIDSISDSPYASRSTNQPCDRSRAARTRRHLSRVMSNLRSAAAADRCAATQHCRATRRLLTASDTTLSAIGCADGGSAGAYQSTELSLIVDGLVMTHLSSFTSSDPSVATVVGSRVVGVAWHNDHLSGWRQRTVDITVSDTALQLELIARIVTSLSASDRIQSFTSEMMLAICTSTQAIQTARVCTRLTTPLFS